MDKLNAQNYMKCSKNVLKKCLKVCGQAIHIAGINDGRVKIEEKNCVFFKVNIVYFGQFYA